jgi:hypothetical protein
VIWIVDQNSEGPWTGLLQVCAGNTGNYLGHYVETGGNLIVIGRDPVYAAGYWPDGTPEPWRRGDYSSWDFRPRWNSAAEESVYHWMWKTFGIAAMKLAVPPIPFTALWPCEGCHPAFTDAVELGPQASRIDGEIHNAAYITRLREGSDVVPLYSTALKQGDDWIDSGGDNLLAVYVPAQGRRGHAAWIGAPEYWFNGDQTKAMIRQLLELFGESP